MHLFLEEVKKWVDEEYLGGRVTVLTDDELLAVIEKNWWKYLVLLLVK